MKALLKNPATLAMIILGTIAAAAIVLAIINVVTGHFHHMATL